MPYTFTRESLYERAWSEPIQRLAKRFSLSDRGFAKICVAANIPVPARGYWAIKHAGKAVTQPDLPPRALGQSDLVHIGRNWYGSRTEDAEILAADSAAASFFARDGGGPGAGGGARGESTPLPLRDSHDWHSQIQKLLNAADERARKQRADPYPSSWNAPIFDTPFETRRFRILNALFMCLTRCGMWPSISDMFGRDVSITVRTTSVPVVLDSTVAVKESSGSGRAAVLPRADQGQAAPQHRPPLVGRYARAFMGGPDRRAA
jgi:hypothetical protein